MARCSIKETTRACGLQYTSLHLIQLEYRLGHRPDNIGHTTKKGNCTVPKPGRAGDVRVFDEQTPSTTTTPSLTFLSTSILYPFFYLRQFLMPQQHHNGLKSCNGRGGGACAVKSPSCIPHLTHLTTTQDFTRIYSSLGLGKGTTLLPKSSIQN